MKTVFLKYHERWAKEKIQFFLSNMDLPISSTILDLGGSNGVYMDRFKKDFGKSFNILIADINERSLESAREKGFETRYLDGGKEGFSFNDSEFDCIFCNSVIEHVTISKDEIWETRNNFRERSLLIQKKFADEIRRCSKSYYVQTPHRHFPIEAHTWFPFIGFMPRIIQVLFIKGLNKFWFKKTTPDWNLLDENQMKEFFPDAKITVIKKMGFKKEIIAIKSF